MRKAIVALAALVALSSVADAQTPHQEAMTKFVARATYIEHRCKDLAANQTAIILIGDAYKLTMDDWRPGGRMRPLLEAYIKMMQSSFDKIGTAEFCAEAIAQFGPGGTVLDGLVAPK